jgi:tetratricopeptide (TPR) repeat protein
MQILAFSYLMMLILPIMPAHDKPSSGQSCLGSALPLYQHQQYDLAQKQLEDCLRADPQDASANELLGLVLATTGDNGHANTYLREALRLAEENTDYRFNLAVFLAKTEQIEAADQAVQPLLSSSPGPDVDRLTGYIRLRQHQEREAVSWFQKALDQAPNSIETLYRLGFSYHSLGEFAQAISCYRRVLELEPEHFFARLQLGKVLLAEGNYSAAEQELTTGARIRPAYPSTWRYLSEAQLLTNKPRAALDSARAAVEHGPEDPRNHYQLGIVLERLGESRAAEAELQTMEELRARQRDNGSSPNPLEY